MNSYHVGEIMRKEHSHKKHHRVRRRIKYWFRHHRRFAVISAAVFVIIAAGILFLAKTIISTQNDQHITAGESRDMGWGYREISYNGKVYKYNSLLTTFLVAGIDSEGEIETSEQYSYAPRADSIYLIAANEKTGKLTIIPINRDTMTDVRRYTISGYDRGTYTTHIGYAYTYGDGGKASCDNLCEAVSRLFGEIPINEYVILNRSSMPHINQFAGGVSVTVPNDDLSGLHPEWKKGATVTLKDEEVEDYLRYRDITEDFSNEGRIERQKSYLLPFLRKASELAETDSRGTWKKIEDMRKYLLTSITENKYISMVELFSDINMDEAYFIELSGENRLGDKNDEFYVDEEELQKVIINTFYEEV